eukprot:177787-Chlamydomonas_euryale.AAC.9
MMTPLGPRLLVPQLVAMQCCALASGYAAATSAALPPPPRSGTSAECPSQMQLGSTRRHQVSPQAL